MVINLTLMTSTKLSVWSHMQIWNIAQLVSCFTTTKVSRKLYYYNNYARINRWLSARRQYLQCVSKPLKWECHEITLPPSGQNGCDFADDIFRCIFVNEKFWILIKISLKCVPRGPIDNNQTLVQIMTWRWIGNKPLPEPMLTRFTDAYMRH